MLRPVQTDESFNLAIDALTCLWGGLIAPRLCEQELIIKLAPYSHLISLSSSHEDAHLSKENYFAICASDERIKDVATHACCMVAVFAHECVKNHPKYTKIKRNDCVQFLRHLRNGGAHGNKFNFIGKKINPVCWQGKTINNNLQGKIVFPDFFAQGDFAYLFEDISKLLG